MNPNRSLTLKQEKFIENILYGYSLADSYRIAYNSSGVSSTVRVEASRLLKQPHITAALHRARLAQEREELRSLCALARQIRL